MPCGFPHVLTFIGEYDKAMACRLLHDSIASYRGHGIWEWAGPFYPAGHTGAPGYVASAAGAYYGAKVLQCDESGMGWDESVGTSLGSSSGI